MKTWRIAHWTNISMSIEILCILNVLDTTQVYTSYLDLASFSRRVSAREPCGQFWDENEKLCRALASILLGSRCPEKHSIESKPIGTIFALGITFLSAGRTTHFWSRSIVYYRLQNSWKTPQKSPKRLQKTDFPCILYGTKNPRKNPKFFARVRNWKQYL